MKRSDRVIAKARIDLMRMVSRSGEARLLGGEPDGMLLIISPGAKGARSCTVPSLAIQHAERDGHVSIVEGCISPTREGLAWLRRQLAEDDPYQAQHQSRQRRPLAGSGPRTQHVLVNDAESPLAWLRSRKDASGEPMLSHEQFEAGERLRRDYTFAAMGPRVTASWSALAPSGHRQRGTPQGFSGLRDDVLAAKERVWKALEAAGDELSDVLVEVCCHLRGVEAVERMKGWPRRSGKVVLQLALSRLARHYGLLAGGAKGSSQRSEQSRVLHWGAEGYRPSIKPDSAA